MAKLNHADLKSLYKGHEKCIVNCEMVIKALDGTNVIDIKNFVSTVDRLKTLFEELKALIEQYIRGDLEIQKRLTRLHHDMRKIELEIIQD